MTAPKAQSTSFVLTQVCYDALLVRFSSKPALYELFTRYGAPLESSFSRSPSPTSGVSLRLTILSSTLDMTAAKTTRWISISTTKLWKPWALAWITRSTTSSTPWATGRPASVPHITTDPVKRPVWTPSSPHYQYRHSQWRPVKWHIKGGPEQGICEHLKLER